MRAKDLEGSLANAGDLSLIRQLAEADTADAVVAQVGVRTAADLAAVVSTGRELGLSLLLENHRFLSHLFLSSYLAFKGSADQGQQLAGFFVSLRGGADNDIRSEERRVGK